MKKNESGFTLIELLVVIAIIGILAAIAIPAFREYRALSYDSRSESDLRNVATAEEAYIIRWDTYKDCTDADCDTILPGIDTMSEGTTLEITGTTTGFTGTSNNSSGSGVTFNWDSQAGGMGDPT